MLKLAAQSVLFSTSLCLVLVLATGSTAETSVVPSTLLRAAMTQGSVRAIVELGGIAALPEGMLPDAAAVMLQRQNITAAQSAVRKALKSTSHRVVRQYDTLPYLAIMASPAALRALDSMRGVVVGVHEDIVVEPTLQQSVPLIRADQAAFAGFVGNGTVIAILDTGVRRDHPFLGGRVVHEACFASGLSADDGVGDCQNGTETQLGPDSAAPCQYAPDVPGFFNPCDHGTHVAGIAAGGYDLRAALRRTGVASGAQVMAVKVFSNSRDDANRPIAFSSDLIAALEHVLATSQAGDGAFNVAAVNMSLAGRTGHSDTASCDVLVGGAMKMAIDNLHAAGIATVVAAGNNAFRTQIAFPACISSAVAVAATGDGGPERPAPVLNRVSSFSNVASTASFPSLVAAPGQWITSSVPYGDGISNYLPTIDGPGYATIAGTSMATPHVAGAFAILKQFAPAASVDALLHALQTTGVAISDVRSGVVGPLPRRIDVLAALESLGPDVTVTAARVLTIGGVPPGGNVSVSVTLKNLGGLPAANFPVTFALTFFQREFSTGPTHTVDVLPSGASQTFTATLAVPRATLVGVYSVRVIADPDNLLNQTNDRNNTRYTDFTVFVGLPDLTVPTVTFTAPAATPGAVAPGGSIGVTHTLRNTPSYATPATTPPSVSGLYLGTTASFTSVIGPALAMVNMPAVGGTDTKSATSAPITKTNVTIPATTAPGRYFLFARANDNDAFLETNTSNNVGVSTTTLIVGPDLAVASASIAAGAVPGGNISVDYMLANRGGQLAGPFTTGFALVPVDSLGAATGADIPIGPTSGAITLAGGLSRPFVSTVGIPSSTTPGSYRVRVIADSGNAVIEADESNNTLLTGIVNVLQPDLAVSSVTFRPAAVAPGANVSITHIVRNLASAPGNAPASVSSISLVGAGGSTTELGRVAVPPLAALGTATVTRSVQIPRGTTPGLYAISAFADALDTIVEASESNNVATTTARLVIGPDLLVTAATTARNGLPGASVNVTYTVRNQGAGSAGPFTVGFSLVPVTSAGAPTGADVPIGPARTSIVLAGGASQSFVNGVVIPSGVTPGPFRIRVIADLDNDVVEAAEDNNTLLTSGILTEADPDLTVPSVTFAPLAVAPGGNVSITHVVKNIAPAPSNAPATTSALYLVPARCDPTADACGASIATVSVPAVAAGTSASVKTTVTINPITAPGKYYVVAWAKDSTFIDQQPSNNFGTSLATLTVGPDIAVTAASTVTTVGLNMNATVRYTLQNKGAGTANGFDVGFALVPVDATGAATGPDVAVGPTRSVMGLAGGATTTLTSSVLISDVSGAIRVGTYRIRVTADPSNAVPEADKTNNSFLSGLLRIVPSDSL